MLYIIGDVHGEISKLQRLVYNIERRDSGCSFAFVGDYIDKGENASDTLQYLAFLKKRYSCFFLLGNHEYYWRSVDNFNESAEQYLSKFGGHATMRSFAFSTISETRIHLSQLYRDFFANLLPYFVYKEYVVTHSGIPPDCYNSELPEIALADLLFNRYDFIQHNGFYRDRYKVIFGHTAFYKPYYDGYKIGIDTGACFLEDQPLTAFNMDDDIFINSVGDVYLLNDLDLTYCPNIIRNKPWRTSDD